MDPLLNRIGFYRLYVLLSSTLFIGCCYCSSHKTTNSDPFAPRNINHYSFEEQSTDVYVSWDPPLNYLLPKSPDLSMNNANAKSDGESLNQLSIPLPDHSESNSDHHSQYNIVNKNAQESTNTSHVGTDLNTTKNLTTKGVKMVDDNQSKHSLGPTPATQYDLYGFVNSYTIFYRQQQDPDVKFAKVVGSQTWVLLTNITADTIYEITIRVYYSNKKQVNSTKYILTVSSNTSSPSVCKCNSIGARGGHQTCNLTIGQPCFCNSGYDGLFCDKCQPKHYRHADQCLPCPCRSQFGTFNCRLVNNAPVCNCLSGHAGKSCDKCANGYFNYYRTCAKCICNNNVDPLSPEICDPDIGACKHCLHNTTGFACNECLPGFVGDPILHKNCTKQKPTKPKVLSNQSEASVPLSLKVGLPLVIIFICITIAILVLQRHRFYRKLQPFWTIELKDDHDSVNFTSTEGQEFGASMNSHSASNHDDMDFYSKHASTSGMQYSPLRETM